MPFQAPRSSQSSTEHTNTRDISNKTRVSENGRNVKPSAAAKYPASEARNSLEGKKTINGKGMTDNDYTDLFERVLQRMKEQYPSASNSKTSINQSSQEKTSNEDKENKQPRYVSVSPKPVWQAVSPINELKEKNRVSKSKKGLEKTPSFSLGDLSKNKKIRKPKALENKTAVNNNNLQSVICDKNYKKSYSEERCSNGIWVQCSNIECCKWRYLDYINDPSVMIGVAWDCSMNQDKSYNSCEKPVQHWDDTAGWSYVTYAEGSLVWAKVHGYPWWPALVEDDPDLDTFVLCDDHKRSTPVEYHVTFFDSESVTRAWIPVKCLKSFDSSNPVDVRNKFCKRLGVAKEMANDALHLQLIERLRKYGFLSRFTGKVGENAKIKQQRINATVETCEKRNGSLKSNKRSSQVNAGKNPKSKVMKKNLTDSKQEDKKHKSKKSKKSTENLLIKDCSSQTTTEQIDPMNLPIDFEKELDEIEKVLSQSSQTMKHSLSMSSLHNCQPNITVDDSHLSQQIGKNGKPSYRCSSQSPVSNCSSYSFIDVKAKRSFISPSKSSSKKEVGNGAEERMLGSGKSGKSSTGTTHKPFNSQKICLENSIFTQELSNKYTKSKAPFLDTSLYTQELSNTSKKGNVKPQSTDSAVDKYEHDATMSEDGDETQLLNESNFSYDSETDKSNNKLHYDSMMSHAENEI